MRERNIIARVKRFLNNLPHISLEDDHLEYFYSFVNYKRRYYVYMDMERCGCFGSEGYFITKDDLNELIRLQNKSTYHDKWDNIVIFDVKNNKIIEPHI